MAFFSTKSCIIQARAEICFKLDVFSRTKIHTDEGKEVERHMETIEKLTIGLWPLRLQRQPNIFTNLYLCPKPPSDWYAGRTH
jgi:hypothetical protein